MSEETTVKKKVVSEIQHLQKKNRQHIRALVVRADVSKAEGAVSSRADANPWDVVKGSHGLIEPPLDAKGLSSLAELSSVLRQCVEAMEVNIPGFGWRLKQYKDTVGVESIAEAVEEERARFEEFLTYADWDENSFTKLRRDSRHDRELIGYQWWEVQRDRTGEICGFRRVPSHAVRMAPKESKPVKTIQRRIIGKGEKREIKEVPKFKHFRKFAQVRPGSTSAIVWFKEYGDPRTLNMRTGEYGSPEEIPEQERAAEIIHRCIYSPRTPYGIPRYIGNLLVIMGARSAEEINFTTFRNNNVPSMAILVSGGIVTDETVDRLKEFVEESVQGSDNYSKFLVIEAVGDLEDDTSDNVKIDMKPLTKEQHTDQLFQTYDGNARQKVRESFRLPPIFIGRSEEYTRATADVSRQIADEQIFAPERHEDDHAINRILRDMGMKYHYFETNTPNITNDQDIIKVIAAAEKAGGMTPRVAHIMLEDIMGQDLPIPENIDLDIPFSLQMAEAVKNKAQPNEPGQQVTAMKLWKMLQEDPEGTWAQVLLGSHIEKAEDEEPTFAIDLGSQAEDIAEGFQTAALFDIAMGLGGRTMLVSNGEEAIGKVRFGKVRRVGLDLAAEEAGLSLSEVKSMFPGDAEVWIAPIEARDKLDTPIEVAHTAGSLFVRV